MAKAVGSDLGTTNSVIATWEGGEACVIIPSVGGARTTPSVVAFTESANAWWGQLVRRQAILIPKGTISSSTPFIGRKFSEVSEEAKAVGFDVVEGEGGMVRFQDLVATYRTEESRQHMKSYQVKCDSCGHVNRLAAVAKGRPICGKCHQPLAWIVDAGAADFAEIAEKATIPVLLDLWATRCAPRRLVSPVLAQLAHEKAGDVKVLKIDIDSAQTWAQRFDLQGGPTLIAMRHGELIAPQTGAAPAALLREWLQGATAPSEAAADGTRI